MFSWPVVTPMNGTLLGILALLLGGGAFVLGWSAPAAICYDAACEAVRGGQAQFLVGVVGGVAVAGLGIRTLWRELAVGT